MPSDWIKSSCHQCGSQIVIHKEWTNPDTVCGTCKLISGKFVDAIEVLLIGNYFVTPDHIKNQLRDLVKSANCIYNKNLRKNVERSAAWRIAELELAKQLWAKKEVRKSVLFAIKVLSKQEKQDEKAKLRSELRAARTVDGTRRWTG